MRCIDVFYGSGGKADKREKTRIETKVGEPGFSIVGGFGFLLLENGEWYEDSGN